MMMMMMMMMVMMMVVRMMVMMIAGGWSGARRHACERAWRGLPRRVHAALRVWPRVGAGACAVRRRVAARVLVAGARVGRRGRAAVDERSAVRAERRAVHVPAGGGCGVPLAELGARGGRHAADGARRRLLLGVGGARRAHVPHRRVGAACGVVEQLCDRVQRDARVGGRVARRGE